MATANIVINGNPPPRRRRHRQRPISNRKRIPMKIAGKLRISDHGMTVTSTKISDLEPQLFLRQRIF
ncbi:hypothetical protein TIFTF001_001657 [Ficus carica]|uniref:Uncharacterized protein n=1 Tax=Ficus carica TaxID=3494 RepID=A0AA88CS68_FICCA|nr:hypothetical protein TIFTF001_001657 [Ficus carica]